MVNGLLVVNNVGIAAEHLMPFLHMEERVILSMMKVNMFPCTMLTRAFLPSMKRRRKGAIINISSVARLQPLPYITVYSATKHFIHAFTEALAQETSGTGVTIQEVNPGEVETSLTKHLPRSRFSPRASPDEFAKSALSTLTYSSVTCGWWPHELQVLLWCCLPTGLRTVLTRKALEHTYSTIMAKLSRSRDE